MNLQGDGKARFIKDKTAFVEWLNKEGDFEDKFFDLVCEIYQVGYVEGNKAIQDQFNAAMANDNMFIIVRDLDTGQLALVGDNPLPVSPQ